MKIIKHIPNAITSMNVLCGVFGVIAAFSRNYETAFYFMLAGAVCDFFDGMAARALKAFSPMGKELDSLADDITFGLAPAMVLFCYLKPMIGWWALIALLIAAFSALRLAKFNIDERQTTSFIGLATPPNAIFWASLVCWLNSIEIPTWTPWILLIGSLISCYLLVSEIPFFGFKSAGQGKKHIIIFLVGNTIILGICATLAISNQQIAIAALAGAICILWYILCNLCVLLHK